MDAKARLDGVREKLREKALANLNSGRSECPLLTVNDAMEVLHAAGVTLPPQPAGPVTSEEAHRTFRDALSTGSNSFSDYGHLDDEDMVVERQSLDAAMPLLARDHGYVKLSEVERRARGWVAEHRSFGYGVESLVAALTRAEG